MDRGEMYEIVKLETARAGRCLAPEDNTAMANLLGNWGCLLVFFPQTRFRNRARELIRERIEAGLWVGERTTSPAKPGRGHLEVIEGGKL